MKQLLALGFSTILVGSASASELSCRLFSLSPEGINIYQSKVIPEDLKGPLELEIQQKVDGYDLVARASYLMDSNLSVEIRDQKTHYGATSQTAFLNSKHAANLVFDVPESWKYFLDCEIK